MRRGRKPGAGRVIGAVVALVGFALPYVMRPDGYSASYLNGKCSTTLGMVARALSERVQSYCTTLAALMDFSHVLIVFGLVVVFVSVWRRTRYRHETSTSVRSRMHGEA
jgi:heme/copper-type cytochrome/quinol oxidase subunit 2